MDIKFECLNLLETLREEKWVSEQFCMQNIVWATCGGEKFIREAYKCLKNFKTSKLLQNVSKVYFQRMK